MCPVLFTCNLLIQAFFILIPNHTQAHLTVLSFICPVTHRSGSETFSFQSLCLKICCWLRPLVIFFFKCILTPLHFLFLTALWNYFCIFIWPELVLTSEHETFALADPLWDYLHQHSPLNSSLCLPLSPTSTCTS